MIAGIDFIVVSDDWGRYPFSCQHIMDHFLPENRLLWVQTIGMRHPQLSMNDLKRSVEKLRSFVTTAVPRHLPKNLTIVSPPMFPFFNRVARRMNRRSVSTFVRRKVRKLGFNSPVLMTTLPNAAEYLGFLEESLAVYYCVDDFTLWPGVNRNLVAEMEKRLIGGVDLLVCSSPELAEMKKRPGLRTEVLPHGVDFLHFNRCTTGETSPVHCLAGLPRPVIGYYGLLGEWVDVDILEDIARSRPEWTIVLMGNVVTDTRKLPSLANVKFTGLVPYRELPDYVANVDVLVLPYRTEGRGQTITPLKLREYIATGKPVVSTAIPECLQFAPYISFGKSAQDFVSAIEMALRESPGMGKKRQEIVAVDGWESRAESLSRWIGEAMEEKKSARCNA